MRRKNLIYWVMTVTLMLAFLPIGEAVVHTPADQPQQKRTKRQEKRLEKFQAKLQKKINRKRAKARKKGRMVGDVMESDYFVWGLIGLAGGLLLALVAGLFGLSFFGWIAGLIAVAGVVLMILGVLETT